MGCHSIVLCGSILFLISSVISGSVPSPYQVSVRLYDNYNKNDNSNVDSYNLCSGAIVHPYFILLSAHCCYSHSISHQISRLLMPNMIYIVAGNAGNNVTTEHVNSIFVHPSYDERTMANNIALLKLENPLNLTNGLQWLELAENSTKLEHCFTSYNNVSTAKPTYPYRAPVGNSVVDSWFCSNKKNATDTTPARTTEICAYYSFSDSFMCKVSENQLKISNDRGTPLICNNKLVGCLSEIILPSNSTTNNTCTESLKTNAYFTKVAPYNDWIHSTIANYLPVSTGGVAVPIKPDSPPFQGATPSPPSHIPTKPVRGAATTTMFSSALLTLSAIGAITWLHFAQF